MPSGTLSGVLRGLRRWMGRGPDEEQADDQLLARFVGRDDPEAFAALVERYGPLVLGVCRRTLGDEHDAEDAFQATFLVFARRANTIRNQGHVGSWLCGTAYRVSLKAKAAAARRRQQEKQAGQMPKVDPRTEELWRELKPVLDEELNRLPEKYRVPLVLCYLEGKTNEAAAKELGWAPGSMSYRLSQARELLRKRLETRGVALTTGLLAPVLATYATVAVPAQLLEPTVQGGLLFSAGQAVATILPAQVVALAEGVLHTIAWLKALLIALLCVLFLMVGGAGFLYFRPSGTPRGPHFDPNIIVAIDPEPRIRVQFAENQRVGFSLTKLRDPLNPDEFKRLTRDPRGLTGNTCFRIDGDERLFGQTLAGLRWYRDEEGRVMRELPIPGKDPRRAWQSTFEHQTSKVRITQQVEIVVGEQTRLYDTALVRYIVENPDLKPHTVGLRALVDTFIGSNDGVPFLVPPADGAKAYLLETMAEFDRQRIPPFIRALESDKLDDPGVTVAEMGLKLSGVEPLDKVVICHWPDNTEARWGGSNRPGDWQYEPINKNPASKDSCVALYWSERPMQPLEKRVLAFTYGLGHTSSGESKDGQVRLMMAGSSRVGGTFTATAYFKGGQAGQKATLELPAGLELAQGQAVDQTVPPADKAVGYSQVSWRVVAREAGEHEMKVKVLGWHAVRQKVVVRKSSLFD